MAKKQVENENLEVKKTEEVKEEKTNKKEEAIKVKPVSKKKNLRELINKDTEVLIMNNCKGEFIYDCPRTAQRFNMTQFGDTDVMTIEQLNAMKNQHRKILDQYWILPLEVYADEVTIEEIFQYLRVSELYKNIELDSNIFDNLLLFSTIEKFKENTDEMSKSLIDRLIERALILFEQGKFYDSRKQDILRDRVNDEYLFTKEG